MKKEISDLEELYEKAILRLNSTAQKIVEERLVDNLEHLQKMSPHFIQSLMEFEKVNLENSQKMSVSYLKLLDSFLNIYKEMFKQYTETVIRLQQTPEKMDDSEFKDRASKRISQAKLFIDGMEVRMSEHLSLMIE
jgi:anion-transporting  ArsA/GET3 family ATPase